MKDVEIVVIFESQAGAPAALPEAAVHSDTARLFMRQLRPLFSPVPGAEAAAAPSPEAAATINDMRRYFVATAPRDDAAELVEEIAGAPSVETAYIKPQAENPLAPRMTEEAAGEPAEAPSIPDFSPRQGYLDAAPDGVDARFAWRFKGGDGSGVTIIDVEGGWQLSHVDLAVRAGGLIGGTQYPEVHWRNHGTAVLAEMGGDKNDFGVVGIAHGALVGAVSHGKIGSAKAIQLAALKLKPGDIILLEMHRPGPSTGFRPDARQKGYIGVEWWPDDLLAIQFAVAKGVIVVEAAGNGGENLDDAIYDTPAPGFPANWKNPFRDGTMSGAIVVGAGAPPSGNHGADRSRLDFSNHGTRVDCQAWGREVVTAGYGDLFRLAGVPHDEDSWFTAQFSGTSSASPIVAGVLACLQGIARTKGKALTGEQLRDALRSTGSPQQPDDSERIGNRPNLRQLIARLFPHLGGGVAGNDPATPPSPGAREPSLAIPFLASPADHAVTAAAGIENLPAMLHGWRKERLCPPGAPRANLVPEIAIGRNESLEAVFVDILAKRRRGVGLIRTSGTDFEGRSGSWTGTGFLVSPNILLTNHHVLNSEDVARAAQVAFDFELSAEAVAGGNKTYPAPGRIYTLRPEQLFVTSPFTDGLDYTFVWIDDVALPEGSISRMERAAFAIQRGERAFVIHHPNGNPKRVSLEDADIVTARPDGAVIHYTSDTEPGSSGSPVYDRSGRLIALHHASQYNWDGVKTADGIRTEYVNEGIKIAAIALDLETKRSREGAPMIDLVLDEIHGSDTLTSFFGAAGREVDPGLPGAERVVDLYHATAQDIDVGFWNIEWFANRYESKVDEVAKLLVDLGLDIWALVETSPAATEALVETIRRKFGLALECAHSEAGAPTSKQSTSVIWNPATVEGGRVAWPGAIEKLFQLRSDDILPESRPLPKPGKIFDRYPGLFHFRGKGGAGGDIDFNLVPLHLKAKAEGWERRRMASQILARAVEEMIGSHGADRDWVLGGDFNAELASGDFEALANGKFVPVSAQDENDGALSYLKAPHSLIDHVFLSPNMSRQFGSEDFFILAKEKSQRDYLERFSDHRPVLLRLSARAEPASKEAGIGVPVQSLTAKIDAILGRAIGQVSHTGL